MGTTWLRAGQGRDQPAAAMPHVPVSTLGPGAALGKFNSQSCTSAESKAQTLSPLWAQPAGK